jgi:hypothetical protein
LLYIHTYNISCSPLVVHTYLQYILFPPQNGNWLHFLKKGENRSTKNFKKIYEL